MVANGSTGHIMLNIAKKAREKGHEVLTFSTHVFNKRYKRLPAAPEGHIYYGSRFENAIHYSAAQFTALNGCYSALGTAQIIRTLKKFKPDVIHLHNLHSFCFHFPSFLRYVKKAGIPVVWTLHDCWTFTGHCPYFTLENCDKWKTGCHHCPQISVSPRVRVDRTDRIYEMKKKWFTGIPNLTLVTPSEWLRDLVGESYLGDVPVKVINNGIDLSVFKPTESDFRKKHNLEGKTVLLGVSFSWGKRKGLDVFTELAKRLDDSFRIVLVGTNAAIEAELPEGIISIRKTNNQTELAEIYTAADILVNPTREENYPTVNMEAIACGTPVVTFRTGGSPEIPDETTGSVVECDDIDGLEREIKRIAAEKPYSTEACLRRAESFDMDEKYEEYVSLYEDCTYRADLSL